MKGDHRMGKSKPSLFDIIARYRIAFLLIFTILFLLVGFVGDYKDYKADVKQLSLQHKENVKDRLKKEVEHYIKLVETQTKNLQEAKYQMLQNRVHKAHLIAQNLYEEYKDTKSETQIKEIIITILRKVRFLQSGYYFIIDTNGKKVLFDEKPELEGKDMLLVYNSDGVFVTKEMLKLAKEKKEGFYTYKWSKPQVEDEREKTSYIKLFEPYGWIIGTGIYLDDLTKYIQESILDNTEAMKFDLTLDNYIFIGQWDGLSMSHPARGKNMYNVQDKNGKYLVQELIQKARDGGGFVEYVMPSLSNERNSHKISYVQGIAKWQWYVGAGAYVDDINEEIELLKEQLYEKFFTAFLRGTFLALILFILFSLFSKSLNHKVKEDFLVFVNFFNKLILNNKKIDIKKIRFSEFEELGKYANEMLDTKIQLEDNLKRYEMIVSSSKDFLSLIDKNYKYVAINETYLRYLQKSKEEIIGKSSAEIFGEEDFEKNVKPYQERALKGETSTLQRWIKFPIGIRYIDIQFFPYKQEGKEEIEYFVVSARDWTQKKKREDEIALWKRVFENTMEAVMICDTHMKIITVNNAFVEITGYSQEEVVGESSRIIGLGGMHNSEVNDVCSFVRKNGQWSGEVKNQKKNGKIYPAFLSASTVVDEEGEVKNYLAVFSDITNIKDSQNKLEFLSYHDTLTKLPNRILLKDRIEHAIENAKRQESLVAVCCLDLDNFKKVNDTYGHSYGDDVLEQTALRIKSAIREADTLSRIGGDEFIVLLENLFDVGEVEKVVKKIQVALEEPFLTHEKQFFLSASIGISQYPQHGNSSEVLIKNADIAMYKAKNAGKNTYRFYAREMSSQTREEVDTENALKVAIKEKQFIVYYQPQVNLKTKQIIGLEALVRWRHPVRGLLGPMQFIRLCEDTKMIIPIGEYVFKQACEDLINLKEETGFEGRVSINVSGIQIEHSDFLGFLEKTLAETFVSPSHLELEITESVIMKNPKSWIEILSSIRRLGVKIAIDDFGTGYSSLSYLRKLPIDKLKIDMSFVRDIPAEEDACAIAKSIINLSDSMKMVTLAEGIETEAQEAYLRENGCEEGQGYLYAKPMDIQSLKNFLQDYPIG